MMDESISKPTQLALVLHAAVDYVYGQGAGLGIVQRAECATSGIIKSHLIPSQERSYGLTREKLTLENAKTVERAQMLVLVHALGLAYGSCKRCPLKSICFQKVVIFLDSPRVVEKINHRINQASDSFQDITSTNDRSMLMRVINGVQRLSRNGLEVTITVPSKKENSGERARTIARQKGRKACKSRRRLRLLQNNIG